MTTDKKTSDIGSNKLIKEGYIPSATERKRVVFYYLLVGILFALSSKRLSKYEYYHLKQSIGWWILFFLVFISSMFLWIIPYLGGLIIFVLDLGLIIIWIIFVRNAWGGYYTLKIGKEEKIFLPIFSALGNWLLEIFDKKFEIK